MSHGARRRELEAAGYREVCQVREVPGMTPLRVELDGRGVLICRHRLGFAAIEEACPHQGASMARGELRRGHIVCPVHLYEFDLRSGTCVDGHSPATVVHELELVGNAVFVRLAPAGGSE